ncbi:MAG TPA: protein kinase [Thermoanaerobaculia bacterium]|jgi:tetratricopeptide (TPR) repeat protein|nr:protein kinase [Thermoanaerobaculia bacterium]
MASPEDPARPAAGEVDPLLDEMAARVADATPVDWEECAGTSPGTAPLLHQLEVLSRLGEAFRQAAAAPHAATATPAVAARWGHLELLSPLGEGSFGEVWRARDPLLDREVALKLAKTTFGAASAQRFLDEARRLARVRHANVVVVHGADVHDGRVGLWTDLVEGQTLEAQLQAQGPLSAREAALVGIDLCHALAAVHDKGLVHGDVKTANVMRERGGRIVLMDFGTVKELRANGEATVTRGTPVTLAPELLRGEALSPAADVYSLGALLYRLVTGRYPVEGNDVDEIAGRHQRGEVIPLRDQRPDLPAPFVAAVEGALATEPRRRYPSIGVMERALAAAAGVARAHRGARLGVLAAVAAVVVALLVVAVERLAGPSLPPPQQPASGPPPRRPAIAVLGFKDLAGSDDAAWLGTALEEMLTTELSASDRLRTIAGEQVARARLELALPPSEALGVGTLHRLSRNLGTDYVVVGSYLVLSGHPERLRVDVRLQDAAAGETVLAVSESGTRDELFDLVSRAGARLRARLGGGGAPAGRRQPAVPTDAEAARLYAEGLARLRRWEADAARRLLEQAISREPGFAPAHSALAGAWWTLGYDERARDEARRAFELGAGLPQSERLLVEARYREVAGDWPRAIAAYRTLIRNAPDELEHRLRLAQVQTAAGQGREALITLANLRRLLAPLADDPRVDLAEAAAYFALGDQRGAQGAAARAADLAAATGARVQLARARAAEARAWTLIGEFPPALAALAEARRLTAELHDPEGFANTLALEGFIRREQGELDAARAVYERARAAYRALGNAAGAVDAQYGIGAVLYQQGDVAGAAATYAGVATAYRALGRRSGEASVRQAIGAIQRQRGELAAARESFAAALALHRQLGERNGEVNDLTSLANVLRDLGELRAAERGYAEALAVARQLGLRPRVTQLLHNLGGIRRTLGELGPARAAYEEALSGRREAGDRSGIAATLRALGKVLAEQGDLAAARNLQEEALALREEIGEQGGIADSRLIVAQLALAARQPAVARDRMTGVAEELRREGRADDEALAQAVLAEALFATGEPGAGETALRRALALAARSSTLELRLLALVPAARLRALREPGRCAEAAVARRDLEEAVSAADGAGHVPLLLAARLALGEVEISCGAAAKGRPRLLALAAAARQRGFTRIAAQAAQLAARGEPGGAP